MKLRVNLLTPDLLPQQILLNFSWAVRGWLLTLVVIAALTGLSQWQLSQLQQEQTALKAIQNQLKIQQEQLAKAKAARKVSPKLQAELEDLRQELEIKQQLVVQVQAGERPNEAPFSTLLVDLARVQEQRIWLDSIEISEQGVSLAGYASKAEVVPVWLSQVGSQGYLQGKTFDQLLITEATPWHRFELNTAQAQEQQP